MKSRRVIIFYLLYFCTIVFIVFLTVISIPNNPISLRYNLNINKKMNALLPEGWAFFTRDCKEEQIYIYRLSDEFKPNILSFKTSDLDQFIGINRHNRVMHNKIGSILSGIDDSLFYESDIDIRKLKIDSITKANVSISNSKICGKYLIKLQKPVSWTWYSSNIKNPHTPYKVIVLNLNCNDK